MNKVDEQMADALLKGRVMSMSNTSVKVGEEGVTSLLLHGNEIARYKGDLVTLKDCGYPTKTTRARMNAVLTLAGAKVRLKASGGRWWLTHVDTGAQSLWIGHFDIAL